MTIVLTLCVIALIGTFSLIYLTYFFVRLVKTATQASSVAETDTSAFLFVWGGGDVVGAYSGRCLL